MKFSLLINEHFVQYQIYSTINRNVCKQNFDITRTPYLIAILLMVSYHFDQSKVSLAVECGWLPT